MAEYKLVPVEPTPEMLEAYCGAQLSDKASYLSDGIAPYKAMIDAAPDVQGEPAAWLAVSKDRIPQFFTEEKAARFCCGSSEWIISALYASPQPVEHISKELAFDAAEHLTRWLDMELCDCEFGHHCGRTQVKKTRDALLAAIASEPAEQRPAPDVSGLVDAAAAALGEIESFLCEAYNNAHPVCCGRAGAECCGSPAPEWSEEDARILDRLSPHQRALNAALAAYRKGG